MNSVRTADVYNSAEWSRKIQRVSPIEFISIEFIGSFPLKKILRILVNRNEANPRFLQV